MHYVADQRKLFIRFLLLTGGLQLFVIGMPMLIQYLFDDVIMAENLSALMTFGLVLIAVVILQTGLTFIRGRVTISLHNVLDHAMQTRFFEHLLRLPYNFFMLRSFGDLLFRAGSLGVIRDQISTQLIRGILDVLTLVVVLVYMLIQSPVLSLVVIALALVNALMIVFTKKVIAEWNQRQILHATEVQSTQTEMLYGIFNVKTSGVEGRMYDKWYEQFRQLLLTYRKKESITNYMTTASVALSIIAPLALLGIGALQVFSGQVTIGTLIAFHAIGMQFFGLTSSIVGTMNSFILTTAYLKRVQDVMDAPPEDFTGKRQITLSGDIVLDHVSYRYSDYTPLVLHDLSFRIHPGQKVAIVGQSGSGKSSLANLIIGLCAPTEGQIYYDGHAMDELDMQYVRAQVGTVPQNISLFNRSILDNIRLHKPEASEEEVYEAARKAQIHDEINAMPMGYHTMIAELGMNISGGQRQRISLAKALLGAPRVLLLDEATSALDHLNEERIDRELSAMKCTRIVIAHRLITVMNSDLIIVLDHGRITDIGTHDELLLRSQYYHHYYQEMAG
jgi:ABC-type bacteriocin/lantibiotic exporter with double-glycine peptidase domain